MSAQPLLSAGPASDYGSLPSEEVKAKRAPVKAINLARGQAQEFLRKTTKYWVHKAHIDEVKQIISKHLPEYRFSDKIGPLVQSIYLDNDPLVRYTERMLLVEGGVLFRYRWYGHGNPKIIFMEQKIRRYGWRGQVSAKLRFTITPEKLERWLRGAYHVEQDRERDPPASLEEIELSKSMQTVILKEQLKPLVRTACDRYCYQNSGEDPVRVSFDENLQLSIMRGGKFAAMDYVRDFKFKPDEVYNFPHAIMEIKLKIENGVPSPMPTWAQELIDHGLITHCDKFSKFNTAVAVLLPNKAQHVPYYLPYIATFSPDEKAKELMDPSDPTPKDAGPKRRDNTWDNVETGLEAEKVARERRERMASAANKQVIVPIRPEPKTFLANERTFLKWARLAMLMALVGIAVLGYKGYVWCGVSFLAGGLLILFRELYLYYARAAMIRNKTKGQFHDPYTPLAFVIVLSTGLILMALFDLKAGAQVGLAGDGII